MQTMTAPATSAMRSKMSHLRHPNSYCKISIIAPKLVMARIAMVYMTAFERVENLLIKSIRRKAIPPKRMACPNLSSPDSNIESSSKCMRRSTKIKAAQKIFSAIINPRLSFVISIVVRYNHFLIQ